MCRVPAATLPGPGRTIVVEPLERPAEAPPERPAKPAHPAPSVPAAPVEEPTPA